MAEEYVHYCENCQAKLSVPEPGNYNCPQCNAPFVIEDNDVPISIASGNPRMGSSIPGSTPSAGIPFNVPPNPIPPPIPPPAIPCDSGFYRLHKSKSFSGFYYGQFTAGVFIVCMALNALAFIIILSIRIFGDNRSSAESMMEQSLIALVVNFVVLIMLFQTYRLLQMIEYNTRK